MRDYKTTIAGGLAALLPWLKTILPPDLGAIVDAAVTLAFLLFAYFARDKEKK